MFTFFTIVPICALIALGFALSLVFKILKNDEGTTEMKNIASAVREGAEAYLRRQYRASGIFFIIVFILLVILSLQGYLVLFVPFAFLTGGLFSGLAGFCGMKIATASSARTANACRDSLNSGLRLAFSSGAVMGFIVVGLGLLDLSLWFYSLDWYYTHNALPQGLDKITTITSTMLTFGMGASFQALFARVGGGIFTKAADVGADLVGKIELGIPEDDARNPAVVADNVGDNVGDVAGMGADLYESYVGSIVATGALGVAAGLGVKGVTVPMILAAVGIIASMLGIAFVKTGEKATQESLLMALRKGIFFFVRGGYDPFLLRDQNGPWRAIHRGCVGGDHGTDRRAIDRFVYGIFYIISLCSYKEDRQRRQNRPGNYHYRRAFGRDVFSNISDDHYLRGDDRQLFVCRRISKRKPRALRDRHCGRWHVKYVGDYTGHGCLRPGCG